MAKTLTNNNIDYVKLVNSINSTVGGLYSYTFPIVDNDNFRAMAAAFLKAPSVVRNAYMDTMANVMVNIAIHRVYRSSNPFRFLYGENINLSGNGGDSGDAQYMQIVAVDQFIPVAYEKTGDPEKYFASHPPKVKLQFICNILRKLYEVTMNDNLVVSAFESVGQFDSFWQTTLNRLYADMEEDDKEEVMAGIDAVIQGGNMFLYPLARPVDNATAIEFSKHLEILVNDMGFKRNRKWNLQHYSTKTALEDAILMLAADVIATQNKYNLAWALNKQYLDLADSGRLIPTDSSGIADNKVFAMYTSRQFFQINNVNGFPQMREWNNGRTLEFHCWLHNWKRLGFAYFENAIAFCERKDVGIGTITLNPARTTIGRGKWMEFDLPAVKPSAPGMLFDAFVTYEMSGDVAFTDETTTIDKWSGTIYVGKNETAKTLTVTATHHIDTSKTAKVTIGVV